VRAHGDRRDSSRELGQRRQRLRRVQPHQQRHRGLLAGQKDGGAGQAGGVAEPDGRPRDGRHRARHEVVDEDLAAVVANAHERPAAPFEGRLVGGGQRGLVVADWGGVGHAAFPSEGAAPGLSRSAG
jgi:hypothetical protein